MLHFSRFVIVIVTLFDQVKLLSVFFFLTGISPEEIVKVSTQHYEKQEQIFLKQRGNKVRRFSNNFLHDLQVSCASRLFSHCLTLYFFRRRWHLKVAKQRVGEEEQQEEKEERERIRT